MGDVIIMGLMCAVMMGIGFIIFAVPIDRQARDRLPLTGFEKFQASVGIIFMVLSLALLISTIHRTLTYIPIVKCMEDMK